MIRLLRANFSRVWKDKLFWAGCLFMFGFALLVCITQGKQQMESNLDFSFTSVFFLAMQPIGILIAAYTCLFIGTEYSDGTLRNKLVVGHSRNRIYLANLITCITAGLLMMLSAWIVFCAVGIPLFGFFDIPLTSALLLIGNCLLTCIAYTAIFTLMAMLNPSKAVNAILSLIVGYGLLFLAVYLYACLNQPEFYDGLIIADGVQQMEKVPNPAYLNDAERFWYQLAMDITPGGQAWQITSLAVVHPWQMLLYSSLIGVATTVSGLAAFARKDLK